MQDGKQALRALRKNPGFTAIAILTLALGVGANAAIFSMINSILLRPLPVQNPAQITVLALQRGHGQLSLSMSYLEFEHMRQQADSPFRDCSGGKLASDGLRVDGQNHALLISYVPAGFFQILGIQAAKGRLLLPAEGKTPGTDPVIVLGYGFWSSQLGADPNVVGKKALVNGHPFTIVGVAPKDFHGLSPLLDMQAYVPYAMAVTLGESPDLLTNIKSDNIHVLGRLKPGVSISGARAALAVEASRLAQQFPDVDRDLTISVYPERLARPIPNRLAASLSYRTLPGLGGTRASAGMHECSESTAGARHGTPTRNGDSRCARQFACTSVRLLLRKACCWLCSAARSA